MTVMRYMDSFFVTVIGVVRVPRTLEKNPMTCSPRPSTDKDSINVSVSSGAQGCNRTPTATLSSSPTPSPSPKSTQHSVLYAETPSEGGINDKLEGIPSWSFSELPGRFTSP